MKSKDYRKKRLLPDKLGGCEVIELPDDYDVPVYQIIPEQSRYDFSENCYYYLNAYVDPDTDRILKLERNKDIFETNYVVSHLPQVLENALDEILKNATE